MKGNVQERLFKTEWRDFSLEHLLWEVLQEQPKDTIRAHLGEPVQEGDWFVWDTEDYTVYLDMAGKVLDLDSKGQGVEDVLFMFRWDLGKGDHILSRKEHGALVEEGRALGLTHALQIPTLSQQDLRSFVWDCLGNQILTEWQINPREVPVESVFMPLLFGALNLNPPKEGEEPSEDWKAYQSLQKAGPEPVPEPYPDPPKQESYPPKPAPLTGLREPDPEQVKVLEYDIACGVAPPERLRNYLETIDLYNEGLRYHWNIEVQRWKKTKRQIDTKYRKAMRAHQKLCEQVRKSNEGHLLRHLAWTLEKSKDLARTQGFQSARLSNLGCIYQYYREAGPRGINGYPVFFSFRLLCREDWEKAKKAILAEQKRRDALDAWEV